MCFLLYFLIVFSDMGSEFKMLISYFLNSSSLASSGRGDFESVSATSSSFPGL